MDKRLSILFVVACLFSVQSQALFGAEESEKSLDLVTHLESIERGANRYLCEVIKAKKAKEWRRFYHHIQGRNNGKSLLNDMRGVSIAAIFHVTGGIDEKTLMEFVYLSDYDKDDIIAQFARSAPRCFTDPVMSYFDDVAHLIPCVKVALQESNAGIKSAEIEAERRSGRRFTCLRVAARRAGFGRFMKSYLLDEDGKEVEL
jgi:hypothetical protein